MQRKITGIRKRRVGCGYFNRRRFGQCMYTRCCERNQSRNRATTIASAKNRRMNHCSTRRHRYRAARARTFVLYYYSTRAIARAASERLMRPCCPPMRLPRRERVDLSVGRTALVIASASYAFRRKIDFL